MDASIQRALHDKVYEKRKSGALELEKLIRDTAAAGNEERLTKIVDQLCQDYAYAIHQPYARNGGLIGLAAASIALGLNVAPYLEKIVPPVIACLSDQDARVRYYACESMYNIAKTCRGEILPYFNNIFDCMVKLEADTEISVKNGAELLDRLIKDIVSDSASSYVSILNVPEDAIEDSDSSSLEKDQESKAFSLPRFIPLLRERIRVLNPYARMFLVSWITLLDSIPDLELVTYLPSFLGGLFRFLDDPNQDVVTSTQHCLERFLEEIKIVARAKKEVSERRKLSSLKLGISNSSLPRELGKDTPNKEDSEHDAVKSAGESSGVGGNDEKNDAGDKRDEGLESDSDSAQTEEEFTPGQDVELDFLRILEILVDFLGDSSDHVQLTALRWIDSFFDICPENLLPFAPGLLTQVLPALSSDIDQVRKAGTRVNSSLTEYILTLPDDGEPASTTIQDSPKVSSQSKITTKEASIAPSHDVQTTAKPQNLKPDNLELPETVTSRTISPVPPTISELPSQNEKTLDYENSVAALTRQFANKSEATRAAALNWLIMLQQKAPQKVVAAHDDTFPALLETLSDTSDTVVTRDLHLLCQISKNSDDSYFTSFMVDLLKLLRSDRRLLETRGNLIIRQLCTNLSPERIYRTLADCLEHEEDVAFASVMVQNLNNNLLTAAELSGLRRKMRNWESRDGQTLFVALFKSWCPNAIATISLCLLAQAYEQAHNILQMLGDIDITASTLIQVDKLIQLLESPVFTYLRLQLLEPDRYPHLYKCLYGILMLLPQTGTFSLLKNRLNCVSAIGYVGVPSSARTNPTTPVVAAFEGRNRLKPRDEGPVRWGELLDRFRGAQDRARRGRPGGERDSGTGPVVGTGERRLLAAPDGTGRGPAGNPGLIGVDSGRVDGVAGGGVGGRATLANSAAGPAAAVEKKESAAAPAHKGRFGAAQLKNFASGVKGKSKK